MITTDRIQPDGKSAEEFLRAELAGGQWCTAFDIEVKADAIGITMEELARARHQLDVQTRQWMGCPKKWRLPDGETPR